MIQFDEHIFQVGWSHQLEKTPFLMWFLGTGFVLMIHQLFNNFSAPNDPHVLTRCRGGNGVAVAMWA